jgi:hypothetical protein
VGENGGLAMKNSHFIIDIMHGLYLVSASDSIVSDLSKYQREFRMWIQDPKNGHAIYHAADPATGWDLGGYVFLFNENDFINWLNEFRRGDGEEKASIVEKIPSDWQNSCTQCERVSDTQIDFGEPLPPEQRDKYGRLGELLAAGVPRIYF